MNAETNELVDQGGEVIPMVNCGILVSLTVPLTDMVARRRANVVGCSLLGTLLVFDFATDGSLKPGNGPS